MNAFGQGTIGLTTVAGEHLVDIGSVEYIGGSSMSADVSRYVQMSTEFTSSSSLSPDVLRTAGLNVSLHSDSAILTDMVRFKNLAIEFPSSSDFDELLNLSRSLEVQIESVSECESVFTKMLQLFAEFSSDSSVSDADLIRMSWGAAITIDMPDDVTYPLIVVSEIVEDAPTNSISVRPF